MDFLAPPKFLESLAEKIIYLLDDESLRKAMVKKSRDLARQYDWEIVTKKYIDVYEEVLNKHK